MVQIPIKHCYSVEPNQLLAGEYPRNLDEESSREKLNALVDAGVTAFIDLTEESEDLLPYSYLLDNDRVTYEQFQIRDGSIPHSQGFATEILDAIDAHIDSGGMVFLHCWGGIGRTGVIVGCWLSRHGLFQESALQRLKELWKQCPKSAFWDSPETQQQERYILEWEEPR